MNPYNIFRHFPSWSRDGGIEGKKGTNKFFKVSKPHTPNKGTVKTKNWDDLNAEHSGNTGSAGETKELQ